MLGYGTENSNNSYCTFPNRPISRVVRQTLSDLVFTLSDGAAILSCLMFDKYSAGCTSGENKCVKNTMVSEVRGVEGMQDKSNGILSCIFK